MIDFKGLLQKFLRVVRAGFGNLGFGLSRADSENGLKLRFVGEWMSTAEHFNDKAAERPDVGLFCVSRLDRKSVV